MRAAGPSRHRQRLPESQPRSWQIARVDGEYGNSVNDGERTPSAKSGNGDFLSMGSVIRTTFNPVSTPTGRLNFNVSVRSVEGNTSAGLEVPMLRPARREAPGGVRG